MLTEMVALVREAPEHQSVAEEFFMSMLSADPGDIALRAPGVVEILEFTMHHLRMPAVRDALVALTSSDRDGRVVQAAGRVLESLQDDWPTGEIYES